MHLIVGLGNPTQNNMKEPDTTSGLRQLTELQRRIKSAWKRRNTRHFMAAVILRAEKVYLAKAIRHLLNLRR